MKNRCDIESSIYYTNYSYNCYKVLIFNRFEGDLDNRGYTGLHISQTYNSENSKYRTPLIAKISLTI